jgi:apolipoprotein N-acyltransferase
MSEGVQSWRWRKVAVWATTSVGIVSLALATWWSFLAMSRETIAPKYRLGLLFLGGACVVARTMLQAPPEDEVLWEQGVRRRRHKVMIGFVVAMGAMSVLLMLLTK